jgi:hypothetical protein
MRIALAVFLLAAAALAASAPAFDGARPGEAPSFGPPSPPGGDALERATAEGIDFLLSSQEGGDKAEWPYEGVYRVGGGIPVGYRVGGTGIVAECLVRLPGYAADARRRDAVRRACAFVCGAVREPLLDPDYDAGYDVRGWGYCYGARFLLALRAQKAVPEGMERDVDGALRWYLDAMQRTEIPSVGGWNYARAAGIETPCPASPFMTAPCLQVLFEARAQGLAVDAGVVERALTALARCRAADGNFAYSAQGQTREPARSMPGAIGRMVCGETVLLRAGRSAPAEVGAAVDDFLQHWRQLEVRRKRTGTHVGPYGVAPYYFFFGFFHACDAVEALPEAERADRRRQLQQLLWAVRDADGTWDDRVFPRSRSFGTAMALMSLHRPVLAAPAAWPDAPKEPAR